MQSSYKGTSHIGQFKLQCNGLQGNKSHWTIQVAIVASDCFSTNKRAQILQEGISPQEERCTYYYGSNNEFKEDASDEEDMIQCGFLQAANSRAHYIDQLLKLPRSRKILKGKERTQLLVDYFQSQLLTSHEHISSLETMAEKKAQQEKE